MKLHTIKMLCCPFDKANLSLTVVTKDLNENILEGFFVCEQCNRIYPIVSGIPIMSPDEYREFKLEAPILERWSSHLEGKTIKDFRLIDSDNHEHLPLEQ